MKDNSSGFSGELLSRLTAPIRTRMACAIVVRLLASLFSVVPYLSILGLSHALTSSPVDSQEAWRWVFIYLYAVIGQSALSSIALLITHFADVKLQAKIRLDLADKLGRLPLGWFDATGSGRLRKIVNNDVESLHQLVAHAVTDSVAAVVTPLVGIVFCFFLDWRLGLVAIVPLACYFVTFSILARRSNDEVMAQIAASLSAVSHAIVDYVGGVAVLKIFGKASQGTKRFIDSSRSFISRYRELVRPQMRAQAFSLIWLAAPVVVLIMVAAGAIVVANGWTEPGRVLVAAVVALCLPSTILTVAAANQSRAEAREAAVRIVELLDEPVLCEPTTPREPHDHGVEFVDVSYSYPTRAADDANPAPQSTDSTGSPTSGTDHPAIDQVNLCVPPASSLALVGPSGSGKSTLASLIARFRDADSGSVRIGGVDVREIGEKRLRQTVGVVLQTVQLPSLSLAENIALANPGASRESIVEAARAARIHDRITQLPRGYDSVVGVDAMLSGGEAQRVCIARVFLQDCPILILDEATSATDPETENEIQQALALLMEHRTVIFIAHRLRTIENVDQIAVIDGGRIVESGTHRELLAKRGHYATMWQTQVGAAA